MSSNVHLDFSPQTYTNILNNIYFTPRELEIIELKRKHYDEWTNDRLAMELCMSTRQLQRCLKKISSKLLKYI